MAAEAGVAFQWQDKLRSGRGLIYNYVLCGFNILARNEYQELFLEKIGIFCEQNIIMVEEVISCSKKMITYWILE